MSPELAGDKDIEVPRAVARLALLRLSPNATTEDFERCQQSRSKPLTNPFRIANPMKTQLSPPKRTHFLLAARPITLAFDFRIFGGVDLDWTSLTATTLHLVAARVGLQSALLRPGQEQPTYEYIRRADMLRRQKRRVAPRLSSCVH